MAEAYSDAEKSIDVEHSKLLKYLEPESIDGKVFATFNPSVLGFIDDYNSLLAHFKAIEGDIMAYLSLTEGDVSLTNLASKVQRLRRKIEDSEHEARIAVQQALKKSNISVMEAEYSERVQKSYDKRDMIKEQVNPDLEVYSKRLKGANIILTKYN
jgi:hypothetical protein